LSDLEHLLIEIGLILCYYRERSDKKQSWENPVAQSHGSKVTLSQVIKIARLSKIAKLSKDGDAKPGI
jgi:hypothetical protein